MELDSVNFIVRSEKPSLDWMTSDRWELFPPGLPRLGQIVWNKIVPLKIKQPDPLQKNFKGGGDWRVPTYVARQMYKLHLTGLDAWCADQSP